MAKPNAIALVTDDRQFPAAAFLATRLAALNPRDDAEVILFSDSFVDLAAAKRFGVPNELMLVEFSTKVPSAAARLSAAAFYRLFVPEMLPDVNRVLYLDVDTYPEKDSIFSLFDLDMDGHPVAGVRDIYTAYGRTNETADELERTNRQDSKYLNSGVLLIDGAQFRAENLGRRIYDTALSRRINDQSAINLGLGDRWIELSPAMNMTSAVWNSFVRQVVDPCIIHFMGGVKPWHGPRFGEDHPVRSELEQFLIASPWRKVLSQNFNFSEAWSNLGAKQSLPTRSAFVRGTKTVLPETVDLAGIENYLKDTLFADVAAGITRMNFEAISTSFGTANGGPRRTPDSGPT